MLKNISVKNQLSILISIAILGFISIVGFSVIQTNKIYDAANFGNVNSVPSLVIMSDIKNESVNMIRIYLMNHILETDEKRMEIIETNLKKIRATSVVFGIQPTQPDTGFGYIRRPSPAEDSQKVHRFVEKPDLATAQQYWPQATTGTAACFASAGPRPSWMRWNGMHLPCWLPARAALHSSQTTADESENSSCIATGLMRTTSTCSLTSVSTTQ